ncbi:hypothetical protein CLV24_108136 [Pontibacter ummariensis]|uniref:Uncharacterized protein n=1 Tax=Pontibacter ummariensis TaxID=1610492 RepID=A0A239F8X9_9BACT|nr:hypothetical protein CLV24_108136 [Pontibacter ummariensis]SNS52773.1 hypothetical protein SAMN06296052_10849 [Pontibacter ummariensis]
MQLNPKGVMVAVMIIDVIAKDTTIPSFEKDRTLNDMLLASFIAIDRPK